MVKVIVKKLTPLDDMFNESPTRFTPGCADLRRAISDRIDEIETTLESCEDNRKSELIKELQALLEFVSRRRLH
jgi:hypothetical protein